MKTVALGYDDPALREEAEALSARWGLPLDNQATNRLLLTADGLCLVMPPFLPLQAEFHRDYWQKRRDEGKKQGLVRACKPVPGMRIIDATAGWGRDAAVLASFGAEVLMLERNPVMAALLSDALARCNDKALPLSLQHQDALTYLTSLTADEYPDLIYLDPMHPTRQKAALVKKDLQALQQMIGADEDADALLACARHRVLKKVVVKWPQALPPLAKPDTSLEGKTVRFDCYHSLL